MQWAMIVRIILETLGPIVTRLVGALVDGEAGDLDRVRDIIPEPLRVEARLASERARLRRLEGDDR